MAVTTPLVVGMAEIQVSAKPAVYTCLGLGSCIGFLAFDPSTGVSGMVHIMLPEAFRDKPVEKPGKFADTGLPRLIGCLTDMGADPRKIVAVYAGGAQVFKTSTGPAGPGGSRLDVGARNAAAVQAWVTSTRMRVIATDVGGSFGRTVTADTSNGTVRVKTIHHGEKQLCALRVQGE